MHFLIQTIGGQIVHDFTFELIQCKAYYDWLNKSSLDEPFDYTLHEGLCFGSIEDPDKFIPVGSDGFVSTYLKTFYPKATEALRPLNVPEALFPFAGRKIKNVKTKDDLLCFTPYDNLFRKSNTTIKDQSNGRQKYVPENPEDFFGYQVSEEINIDSEWRLFIFRDEILHISNYAGDPLLFPDLLDIFQINKAYKGKGPAAYTLDVGVSLDHENHKVKTFVIECHRFFSCGLYGFSDRQKYPIMLSQAWHEIKNTK